MILIRPDPDPKHCLYQTSELLILDLLLSMSLDSYNAFRVQNLMVEKVDLLTKCSRLWVDGHVPVILLEEGDNKKLPNFIQRRMMEVRVVLENEEGGARTSVNLASDMSTTRVMETICLALSLKSDYLRLTALNTGSEREPPLLSGIHIYLRFIIFVPRYTFSKCSASLWLYIVHTMYILRI